MHQYQPQGHGGKLASWQVVSVSTPTFTREWYEQQLAKQAAKAGGKVRSNSQLQEQEAAGHQLDHGQAVQLHGKNHQEADASNRKQYIVRFVFLVSDRKRRDGYGMSETVADCLIRAIARFNRRLP